jgi:flagellar FliL protein
VKTKAHGKEFVPKELGVLYPLEGFLVNVQSDRGTRFLQMKLELELDTPALEDEIVLKRPALRDAIIMLLSGRTYNELRDSAGIKKLRGDLQRSVNNVLKTGQVKDVYFTQFHFN